MFGLSLTVLIKLINLKDERSLGIIVTDIQMNKEIDMIIHQMVCKVFDLISLKT